MSKYGCILGMQIFLILLSILAVILSLYIMNDDTYSWGYNFQEEGVGRKIFVILPNMKAFPVVAAMFSFATVGISLWFEVHPSTSVFFISLCDTIFI